MRLAFKLFGWLSRDQAAEALEDDYLRVFAGEAGRRVLADILNAGHIAESTGHLMSARRSTVIEGRRQLALEIFDKAGGARSRLPDAIVHNTLNGAMNHERDPRRGARREPDPVTITYDDADLAGTDGDAD